MKTKDLNVVLKLIEHKLAQSKSRIVLLERRVEQLEIEPPKCKICKKKIIYEEILAADGLLCKDCLETSV